MKEVFSNALSELNNKEEFVVASVVRTSGSTPQKPGSKLLVKKDGTTIGTLGGGCVEGDIWFASKEILSNGGDAKYQDYVLNEDLAANDGLVCGGTMYFLIDPYRAEKSDLNNQLLNEMNKALSGTSDFSIHAPRIETMNVAADKKREVIGSGGKVI